MNDIPLPWTPENENSPRLERWLDIYSDSNLPYIGVEEELSWETIRASPSYWGLRLILTRRKPSLSTQNNDKPYGHMQTEKTSHVLSSQSY